MDKIQTHAGSGEDSIFEILWKSGDVTWLPYYQIKHLQALETYLELMGVEHTSQLITGKGKPPQENPQIFLGAISLSPTHLPPSQLLPPFIIISPSPGYSITTSFLPRILDISLGSILFYLHNYTLIYTQHFTVWHIKFLSVQFYIMVMRDGIQHPHFLHLSKTEYSMIYTDVNHRGIIHVGQIQKFLAFDKSLHDGHDLAQVQGIPLGYNDFVRVFNAGTFPQDTWHLSTIVLTPNGKHVIVSHHPITLIDFLITPEQCGMDPNQRHSPTDAQVSVYEEYTLTMATQSKHRRDVFQTQEDKHCSQFSKAFAKNECK